MIYKVLDRIDGMVGIEPARAHCDIPCGIYDPITAQIAALTVIRMVDLMTDLEEKHPAKDLSFHNSLVRYVAVKEEHAIKCKEEIRVIWGDYIKPNHVKEFPEVHALVHKIMQLGSKSRQTVSRETAVELLEAVNQFAEMFWKTKGIATKRAKAPYAPAEEVVYPAL